MALTHDAKKAVPILEQNAPPFIPDVAFQSENR